MTKPKMKMTSREIFVQSAAPETATLGEVLSGYINHIGTCIDGAGNVFSAATQDGPNAGDVDVVSMKRSAANGGWSEAFRFTEAQYGKHGYGDLVVLTNGQLCCTLSERNAAGAVVFKEYLLSGLAVPPQSGGAIDSLVRQCLCAVRAALVPLG
jgi:hypothetical protein